MESNILWYDLHRKTPKSQGLVVNPYDRCISNRKIHCKQCTVAWYVDDNEVSYINKH